MWAKKSSCCCFEIAISCASLAFGFGADLTCILWNFGLCGTVASNFFGGAGAVAVYTYSAEK